MNSKKNVFLITILVSVICAFMTHSFAVDKLIRYAAVTDIQYNKLDFFNLALLTTEFNKYDYLSRQDYTLGFLPFLFLFFGTALVSASFLMTPKSYHGFLLVRSEKIDKAMEEVKGKTLWKSILFVFTFIVTLYGLATFNLPQEFSHRLPYSEGKLVGLLFLHGLVKILVLQLLSSVTFLFYRLKETSFALLAGTFLMMMLYLIDLQWEGMNVILFYPKNYFIESIIILSCLYFMINRFSIRYLKLDYTE